MASYFTKKTVASPLASNELADAQAKILKLTGELELLQGVKLQNDGLKAQIHAIAAESDQLKKSCDEKVKQLEAQIEVAAKQGGTSTRGSGDLKHAQETIDNLKAQRLKLEENIRKLMLALKQANYELKQEKTKSSGETNDSTVQQQYQLLLAESEALRKSVRDQEQQHLSATRLLQAQIAATDTQLKEAKTELEELRQPLNPETQSHWEQQVTAAKAETFLLEKEIAELKETNASQTKRLRELENAFEKVSSENSAILERLSQQQKLMKQESTVAIDSVTQEAERARQTLANRVEELEQDKVVLMAQHQCAVDQLKHDNAAVILQLQVALQNEQEKSEQQIKDLQEKLSVTVNDLMEQHKRELEQGISADRIGTKLAENNSANISTHSLTDHSANASSQQKNIEHIAALESTIESQKQEISTLQEQLTERWAMQQQSRTIADKDALILELENEADRYKLEKLEAVEEYELKIKRLESTGGDASHSLAEKDAIIATLENERDTYRSEMNQVVEQYEQKLKKQQQNSSDVVSKLALEDAEAQFNSQLQNQQQLFQTKIEAQIAQIKEREVEIEALNLQYKDISVKYEILLKESDESKNIIDQQKSMLAAVEQDLNGRINTLQLGLQAQTDDHDKQLQEQEVLITQLKTQLGQLQVENETIGTAFAAAKARSDELETELEGKRAELKKLQEEAANTSQSLAAVHDEESIIHQQLSQADAKIKTLQQEKAELEVLLETERERSAAVQASLENTREQLEAVKESLSDSQAQVAAIEAARGQAQTKNDQLEATLAEKVQLVAEVEQEINILKTQQTTQVAELQAEKENFAKSVDTSAQQLNALQAQLSLLKDNCAQLQADVQEKDSEISNFKAELDDTKEKLDSLHLQHKDAEAQASLKMEALTKQLEVANSEISEKAQLLDSKDKQTALLEENLAALSLANEKYVELQAKFAAIQSDYAELQTRLENFSSENQRLSIELEEDKNLKTQIDSFKQKLGTSASEVEAAKTQKSNMERAMKEAVETVRNEKRDLEQRVLTLEEMTAQLQEERNQVLLKISGPQTDANSRAASSAIQDVKKFLSAKKTAEQPISSVIQSTSGQDVSLQLKVLKNHLMALEEEVKFYQRKNSKLSLELDEKGKVLSQYILRENAMAPIVSAYAAAEKQGVVAEARNELNPNPLSSTAAMSKMDPKLVSQVNSQLQKLLEDTVQRLTVAEQELQQLKKSSK